MVRHSGFRWLVAVLALGWARPASADAVTPAIGAINGTQVSPLFVTGNAEIDLPASTSTTIVPGQAANAVAQPTWMTQAGLINGYVMKDIRLSYDAKTDTLAVAVNFYGIAGNTDGTANGGTNPLTTAAGGSNPPHIGGDKSISIAFTPVTAAGVNADPVVVAGVPANKSVSPAGSLDGFDVASVNKTALQSSGIAQAYGTTLTANLGALAYDPSAAHPDLEFTIKNFSKIPGLNALTSGFYISAYAGTGSTIIVGKSAIPDTLVQAPQPQSLSPPNNLNNPGTPPVVNPTNPIGHLNTPEPSTILAWSLVAGFAGLRARRGLRSSNKCS
jgi:hypothetical protein